MKKILITFAGRRKFLEILFKYIDKYSHHIDEYHIYAATNVKEDLDFIKEYSDNRDFVKVFWSDREDPIYLWNECYKNSKDEDSVYLKLDDDIVFLEENLFTDFINFRIENKEYPIIYPLIINNSFMSWLLQKEMGFQFSDRSFFGERWESVSHLIENYININNSIPDRIINVIPEEYVLCPVGWGNVDFSKSVHETFLNALESNNLSIFRKSSDTGFELKHPYPVSINCCSWLGSGLKRYTDKFGDVWQDEPWLSVYLPILEKKNNYVYSGTIVSHFSYYIQQNGLLSSNILDRYKNYIK